MFIRTNGRLINTDHIEMLFIGEHTSMKGNGEEVHDGYQIEATLDNSTPGGIKVILAYFIGKYGNEAFAMIAFNELTYAMNKAQCNSVIDFERICDKAKDEYSKSHS